MKSHRTTVIAVALLASFLVHFAVRAWGEGPPLGQHESVKCEVLRVFSAKLETSVHRDYLVRWQGQKVIVSDPLVRTDYKAGDKIQVLVLNQPYPNGKAKPGLLNFTVTL